MELKEAILGRRSIRAYQKKDVPHEIVEELLELASWAPSANNQQMWFYIAIHSPKAREEIASLIEKKLDEICSWPEAKERADNLRQMNRYAKYIREAPWLIAFCLEESRGSFEEILLKHGLSKEQFEHWRPNAGLQSVAASIQNFLLAAHSKGLGTVWMVGPLFAVEEIEAFLSIKPSRRIVALVPLGYPAESPTPKERKPKEDTWKFIE